MINLKELEEAIKLKESSKEDFESIINGCNPILLQAAKAYLEEHKARFNELDFIIFDVSNAEKDYKAPEIKKVATSKKFQLWTEGYSATGEHAPASLLGTYDVDTIDEAVALYLEEEPTLKKYYKYQDGVHSIWACRLFDNEQDARKNYG